MTKIFSLALVLLLFVLGCNQKTEYERMVAKELERDVRKDSLFLGYHFGMTKEEFFEHSWSLNRKGLVVNGGANSIEYYTDSLKAKATVNFYPRFYENKIYKMPVIYRYNGWAPWNPEFHSDSLQIDVMNYQRNKFGYDFIKVYSENLQDSVFVAVVGNKRISIGTLDDHSVKVEYTDLTVEREILGEKFE